MHIDVPDSRGGEGLPDLLRFNDLTIHIAERRAWLHGRGLALTPTEFRLLATLAYAPDHLFAYCDLAERVLGYTCNEREARANLRVHVMNLRRKLRADGCRCYDIVPVRGAGYRFVKGTDSVDQNAD